MDARSASAPSVDCVRLASSTAATAGLTTKWRLSTATMKRSSPSNAWKGLSSTSARNRGVMVSTMTSEVAGAATFPVHEGITAEGDRQRLHFEAGFELCDRKRVGLREGTIRRIHE